MSEEYGTVDDARFESASDDQHERAARALKLGISRVLERARAEWPYSDSEETLFSDAARALVCLADASPRLLSKKEVARA